MNDDSELRGRMEKIEGLVHEFERNPDPALRANARELVRGVLELHREALTRIVGALAETQGAQLDRLAGDGVVSSVLLLHGLHPVALEARVASALETVKPLLGAHGGAVELVAIAEGAVRIRFVGACDGCPSSEETLRHAVEDAILAAAPDVVSIELAPASREARSA